MHAIHVNPFGMCSLGVELDCIKFAECLHTCVKSYSSYAVKFQIGQFSTHYRLHDMYNMHIILQTQRHCVQRIEK